MNWQDVMKKQKQHKTFVLDTNVILHDATCLHNFHEHDVVIPLTVIEEIDHFKRGSQMINLNAREFARTLDELSGDEVFTKGIPLGPKKGMVRVAFSKGISPEIKELFSEDINDHRILGIAIELQKSLKSKSKVILVTKDVNLRMKAKALALPAEDYTTDKISNLDELYRGMETIEGLDDRLVNRFYTMPYEVPAHEVLSFSRDEVFANKYFILRNEHRSVIAKLSADKERVLRIDKVPSYGITPKNAEQIFATNALLSKDIPLVTLTGKAGTGKTLLALAAALEMRKYYRQILIARPVVPLSNKDLGFLPGDVDSKLAPYMQPLWDNLKIIQDQFKEGDKAFQVINDLTKSNKLVIEPLSYIRGRSLQRIFFIIDEAQNLTPHEIKTIITRAGEGVKIVFTGDLYQIDHPYLDAQSNGLSYLIEHFKGHNLYAHINLVKGERSELADIASNLL